MNSTPRPLTFGELLEHTFSLIGRTFLRNLRTIALTILPATMIFTTGTYIFYGSLGEAALNASGGAAAEDATTIVVSATMLFFGFLALVIGSIAADVGISFTTAQEFSGKHPSWPDCARETFSTRLWRSLAAALLKAASLIAVGVAVAVLATFVANHSVSANASDFLPFLVLLPVVAALAIWLGIAWDFTTQIIACDNASVLSSFTQSKQAVSTGWWRVFGILLLLGLLVSFAVSAITIPLQFLLMLGPLVQSYSSLGAQAGASGNPEVAARIIGSMGIPLGLVVGLSMGLTALADPVYKTVLLFDLRARLKARSAVTAPASGGIEILDLNNIGQPDLPAPPTDPPANPTPPPTNEPPRGDA